MQSVVELKGSIDAEYADLLTPNYPVFSQTEVARRQGILAEMTAARGLDALIAVEWMRAGTATSWITGWPVTAEAVTLLMPGSQSRMFIQHFNHIPLARQIACNAEVIWGAGGAVQQAADMIAKSVIGRAKIGVIGRMPVAQTQLLTSRFDVVDMSAAYTHARMVKSDEEIRWLSLAAALTDMAAAALYEGARPGLNERELSALVQAAYLPYGATNFIQYFQATSIDASGGAVPRQYPSGRKLAAGDVLSTELSADYWGYTGQVLRTFFIGREPNALYRELHAVADEVLDRILGLIRPGVHVRELVEASQKIEESGFTIIDDLIHGYGGGYLPPILGSKSRPAAGEIPDLTLRAGMGLVVQPNVVTKNWMAGVQTGQLVVVTEDGVRSLQRFPRGYHVIGCE